jgi:hypothetical protein
LESVAKVRATDSISAFTKLSVMGSEDAAFCGAFFAGGAACAPTQPLMAGAKAKPMAKLIA